MSEFPNVIDELKECIKNMTVNLVETRDSQLKEELEAEIFEFRFAISILEKFPEK